MSKRRSGLAKHRRAYCNPVTIVNCSPGTITIINILEDYDSNWLGDPAGYTAKFTIDWDALPGVSSYTVETSPIFSPNPDIVVHSPSSATNAFVYVHTDNYYLIEHVITITANTPCGVAIGNTSLGGCFLPGSLVQMADGTTKAIEDVCVNDLVLGAFGEFNTVLALHHPLLGDEVMCNINGEHSTTNHHPHISFDKKFYCGNTEPLNTTYGQMHQVIDAEGNVVERMLHGLKKDRILKLELGIELKTVGGSKVTQSLETYSMPPDTQLYHLMVGGSHTYHVDGYAVTGWPDETDFDYDEWTIKN